ncbi:MAG: hypothetical protein D6722_09055, partial [Bacteroidetes bacterium]
MLMLYAAQEMSTTGSDKHGSWLKREFNPRRHTWANMIANWEVTEKGSVTKWVNEMLETLDEGGGKFAKRFIKTGRSKDRGWFEVNTEWLPVEIVYDSKNIEGPGADSIEKLRERIQAIEHEKIGRSRGGKWEKVDWIEAGQNRQPIDPNLNGPGSRAFFVLCWQAVHGQASGHGPDGNLEFDGPAKNYVGDLRKLVEHSLSSQNDNHLPPSQNEGDEPAFLANLPELAKDLQLAAPVPLLRDTVIELFAKPQNGGEPGRLVFGVACLARLPQSARVEIPVLIPMPTKDDRNRIERFRLVLEWVERPGEWGRDKDAMIYPAPAFAPLEADTQWEQAIELATKFVKKHVTEWPTTADIRWRLESPGNEGGPLEITRLDGRLAALPFILALTRLFALRGYDQKGGGNLFDMAGRFPLARVVCLQ